MHASKCAETKKELNIQLLFVLLRRSSDALAYIPMLSLLLQRATNPNKGILEVRSARSTWERDNITNVVNASHVRH